MAQLLDEMESDGGGLVVLRYGRPCALIVPIEQKVRRAPRRVTIEQGDEMPFEMPELDENQRLLLNAMAVGSPDPYHPDEWRGPVADFGVASVRLEMAGLIEQGSGGFWLTPDGERAAAKLSA